ncbi:uncharacterized protein LOC130140384 [Syzygium oleosum]|uniref:uncharacterized protein LOC130140384 n=1 Tax=Syzygium oleosum TaxID=219896 RepID=UPI0024B9F2B9|nr:uncharacterized protein LOC130140384 [Syzygium oleosum]
MGTRGQSSAMGQEARDPRLDAVIQTLQEIGNLMGRQAQERAANIAQAAAAAAVNGNQANLGQAQVVGNRQMHQLVEQFLKLKPPKFDGKGDPEAAPRWVEELEKAFEVLGCTEAKKVTLAVYQLQENTSDWWKATRGRVFAEGTAQTWDVFAENFNEKYFSVSARERKMTAFFKLRQNQMTVDHQLIPVNLRTYEELYERAQAIEQDATDRAAASGSWFASAKDNRRFGKKPMTGNRRFVPPVRKNIGKPNHPQSRFGACFKCGSMDHKIRNCLQQRSAGPPMQPQQPRVENQTGNPPPAIQGRPPA